MDDPRTFPIYTFAEAARCLGMPVATLRAWFKGQPGAKAFLTMHDEKLLSFFEMMQADALFSIGPGNGTTLRAFRKQLSEIDPMDLVSRGYFFDRRSLYWQRGEQIISCREKGQTYEKNIIRPYLRRVAFDRQNKIYRVHPFINRKENIPTIPLENIVIDPRICYGSVFHQKIKAPVQIIGKRFDAGETVEDLAADYATTTVFINEALMARNRIYVMQEAA